MTRPDEGFLGRWSRRKRAVQAAPEAPPPDAPPAEAPPAEAPPAQAFDPASLPPLESLDAASDFSGFLRPGVPDALRRAALRRAWTLDPAIRNFVGPADYAWDYNAPDGVPGFALELRGDVARLLAQAIGAAPAPAEEAPPPSVAAAPPRPKPMPGPAPELAPAPLPEPAPEPPQPVVAMPPRRHGGAMPV